MLLQETSALCMEGAREAVVDTKVRGKGRCVGEALHAFQIGPGHWRCPIDAFCDSVEHFQVSNKPFAPTRDIVENDKEAHLGRQ